MDERHVARRRRDREAVLFEADPVPHRACVRRAAPGMAGMPLPTMPPVTSSRASGSRIRNGNAT